MTDTAIEPRWEPIKGRWASIDTVAAYLDVSTDTVRRMIRRKEIEARRFGPRLIRVDLNTLDSSGVKVGSK